MALKSPGFEKQRGWPEPDFALLSGAADRPHQGARESGETQ